VLHARTNRRRPMWNEIGCKMGRTMSSVYHRWTRTLRHFAEDFTHDQDECIIQTVHDCENNGGTMAWKELDVKWDRREGDCEGRYRTVLFKYPNIQLYHQAAVVLISSAGSPNANTRTPFTPEEDAYLLHARAQQPTVSFKLIAEALGRAARSCAQRYVALSGTQVSTPSPRSADGPDENGGLNRMENNMDTECVQGKENDVPVETHTTSVVSEQSDEPQLQQGSDALKRSGYTPQDDASIILGVPRTICMHADTADSGGTVDVVAVSAEGAVGIVDAGVCAAPPAVAPVSVLVPAPREYPETSNTHDVPVTTTHQNSLAVQTDNTGAVSSAVALPATATIANTAMRIAPALIIANNTNTNVSTYTAHVTCATSTTAHRVSSSVPTSATTATATVTATTPIRRPTSYITCSHTTQTPTHSTTTPVTETTTHSSTTRTTAITTAPITTTTNSAIIFTAQQDERIAEAVRIAARFKMPIPWTALDLKLSVVKGSCETRWRELCALGGEGRIQ
jgi:hypothetical protein